ncbi:MAG: TRL-like family protein [Bacteroidales bacterium]
MKKFLFLIGIIAMLGSCASVKSPAIGLIYSDVKAPLLATSNEGSSKVGKATVQSILGAVAMGDASIEAAAKEAGIKKIHHVDYHSKSIIGIIATYEVYVYGE